MPLWLLHMVLKPLIDLLFKVLLAVLKEKVKESASDVDNQLVDVLEREQEDLKSILKDSVKRLHPEDKREPLKGIWKSIGRRY